MEEAGISESNFRQLLLDFSRWYDGLGYINMLKVLYNNRNHVPIYYELSEATEVMSLLRLLIGSGNLSPTNLTILYDTIVVTRQFGFNTRIVLPPLQRIRERQVSSFTKYRQFLLKLGMVLTKSDRVTLDVRYNMPLLENYKDNWLLILDLEQKNKLCEERIDEFIEGLPSYLAVKAILEGNEEPSTSKRSMLNEDNGEASTSKKPKLDKGYCGPSAMSAHQQQPPPAKQLLQPQHSQHLMLQSLQRPFQGYCGPADGMVGSAMSTHQQQPPPARQLLLPEQLQQITLQSFQRPSQGYCGPADGMGESAMSSHQQQPPPARQLLLPQQLQQLQAQDAYNYLAWNQPIPDSSRSAVQGNRPMESLQRPSPGRHIVLIAVAIATPVLNLFFNSNWMLLYACIGFSAVPSYQN
ncbi:uncharacterized protein LOC117112732 isoform X2 [Anneissia japonica]|uniref:uncharacterized protein LOC117112732 isoform X2 n=1 Tax=Anneissia japonica TaxID=1529436 RepID=UPI00142584B1|nr:uncharacterized protein LOC117112732 isoform X2 [Anneissia japonica]